MAAITFFLPSTLPADLGLPQSIITLREAVLGLLVISAYLGWSRSILPSRLHMIDGRPTVSRNARIAYYAAVVILAVVVTDLSYFDLIVPRKAWWTRVAWYGFLVATPILVQGGFLDAVLPFGLRDWIGRATEAFIAAFVISAYFDFWRSPFGATSSVSARDTSASRAAEAP